MNTQSILKDTEAQHGARFIVHFDVDSLRSSDPRFAARKQETISRIYSLKTEYNELVAEMNASNVEFLEAAHAETIVKCRTAKRALEETEFEGPRLRQFESKFDNQLGTAHFELRMATESKPRLSDFPTKDELREWEEKVQTKQREVERSLGDVQRHAVLVSQWQQSCKQRKAELDALAEEEKAIRTRLNELKGTTEAKEVQRHSEYGL